jgi:hypothetical protein
VHVQVLFVHDRLMLGLLAEGKREQLRSNIDRYEGLISPEGARGSAYEIAIGDLLRDARPPELAVLEASGEELDNRLVVWTQAVYVARASETDVRLHGKLDAARDVEVVSRLSFSRLLGHTARSEIFGHHRLTIIGYARHESDPTGQRSIALTSLFVGRVDFSGESDVQHPGINDRLQTFPQLVEQFAPVPGARRLTLPEIRAVSNIPEVLVKRTFARVIGEPFVEKDWGGEKSDLFTTRLIIDGRPVTAAFAFKGPGLRVKLTVKGMGKNADQGLRLADEPAELMVVQHHREIDSQVANLMSSLARSRGKRFMVIDGADTAQILRDRGGVALGEWMKKTSK